jgi:hypothetical protein
LRWSEIFEAVIGLFSVDRLAPVENTIIIAELNSKTHLETRNYPHSGKDN